MGRVVARLAPALVIGCLAAPAYANPAKELRAQLEIAKRQEATANAEIKALRKKIRDLEMQRDVPHIPAAARTAMAADVPVHKAEPPKPAPSWAGFYLGYGFGRDRIDMDQGSVVQTVTNTNNGTFDTATSALAKQAQYNSSYIISGYLWQFDRWLLGIEGDYALSGGKSWAAPFSVNGCQPGVQVTGSFGCQYATAFGGFETKGHLRAVAGFEITPSLMAFVAGGLAIAESKDGGVSQSSAITASPNPPLFLARTSSYQGKMIYGTSIGGGMQAKLTDNWIGRLEYLHDSYSTGGAPAFTITASNGPAANVGTASGGNVKYTNDSVRAALIYRFDPNATIYETAARDWANFIKAPAQQNRWAGFYVGGGVTQNNFKWTEKQAYTVRIDDSTTPGLDVNDVLDLGQGGNNMGNHWFVGYRFQWNRFLVGIERGYERGNKMMFEDTQSVGFFNGPSAPLNCYQQFLPSMICVGGHIVRNGFESKGHLRYTFGYEFTPNFMAYVATGKAYGHAYSGGAGASGIAYVAPSLPLAGAATVSRIQNAEVSGRHFGAGFEFKISDHLSLRGEYYRDKFDYNKPLPVGGAGFGGTIGTITTNIFARASNPAEIVSEAYRVSLIYRFWNPQPED